MYKEITFGRCPLVPDEAECKAIAVAEGKTFKTNSRQDWPADCYTVSSVVYYNRMKNGYSCDRRKGRESYRSCLCKLSKLNLFICQRGDTPLLQLSVTLYASFF